MQAFVQSECPGFWDDFVESRSPMLFHRSLWANVLQDGYGGVPLYCWLEREGRPVVGMMGGMMDFKVARLFYSSLPFGGLVGDVSAAGDFLKHAEPMLKKRGVHQIHLLEPCHLDALEDLGYHPTVVARHQVDVTDYDSDSLFKDLHRSVRKAIRKSRKENVEVLEVTDRSQIEGVFDLYVKTMAHNQAATKYPVDRFTSIFDRLVPRGLGVILVATCNGTLVGSNTLVCSDDTVHDIQLSYDHDYQHVRPNDALVFASLEWTIKKGRRMFDFMGSPADDASLERFKGKWLAERSTTSTYVKTLSPLRGACWKTIQKIAGNPAGAWLIRSLRRVRATRGN